MKKRIVLLLMLASLTSLYSIGIDYSNYKKFITYTNDISLDDIKSKEVIFFGSSKEFLDFSQIENTEILKHSLGGLVAGLNGASTTLAKGFVSNSKDMLSNGLSAGVAGLGIGLVFGSIEAYQKGKKNQESDEKTISVLNTPFYLVEDIENTKSEKSRKISMVTISGLLNKTEKEEIDLVKIKSILEGN